MANPRTTESHSEKDKYISMVLQSQAYPSLMSEDETDYICMKSNLPMSQAFSPPTIMKVVKIGSRAEQLYLPESDIDYIFEIGPMEISSPTISQSKYPLFLQVFFFYYYYYYYSF